MKIIKSLWYKLSESTRNEIVDFVGTMSVFTLIISGIIVIFIIISFTVRAFIILI